MSHIILKKWEQVRKNIELHKDHLDARSIVDQLMNLIREIRLVKDAQVQNLYDDYLKYFENLNIDEILYTDEEVWYSLHDIIEYDFLQSRVNNYNRAIIHIRDILFNLLIFKSNKECPCHHDDDLRVFSLAGSEKLIFECDTCLCLTDENNRKYQLEGSIVPAPVSLIRKKNLAPSPV